MLRKQLSYGYALPILRDIKRTAFDIEAGLRTDPHRRHDRGVQVCDRDGIFNGDQRTFVGRFAIHEAALHSSTEHHDTGSAREMTVESIVLDLRDQIDTICGLIRALLNRELLQSTRRD